MIKSTGHLPDIKKAINLTLHKTAQDVRSEAVVNAQYKTGTLRRSILSDIQETQAVVWSNLPYARMREFGWTIVPKRAKMLAWKSGWVWHYAKKVVQKAHPYLIPAYEKWVKNVGKVLESFIAFTTK
jgi:hypothetical protein